MAQVNKVKWGVLGVASIATRKVIPGMQKGEWSEVTAIASRSLQKAKEAARELGIAKAHGSYEELLADAEIEAVYIPPPSPSTARAGDWAAECTPPQFPIALNAE